MKATIVISSFLVGLATLFPPVMFSKNAKWSFLFDLPPVVIHGSGRALSRVNWSTLIAEYILVISFSISMYFGRKWFLEKRSSKETTVKKAEPAPEATEPELDPIKFVNDLIAKDPNYNPVRSTEGCKHRIVCNDGNCNGIMGPDGCCTECGKKLIL